jgi:hypothetical protein
MVDTFTIIWEGTDPDEGDSALLKIRLDYSSAGGAWQPIDSNLTNSGYYLWKRSGLPEGSEYRVRVTASDPAGLTASDSSDNSFTVADAVIITDITGMEWDITHAVVNYNMTADGFNYGLGPYAFTPVIMPDYLLPGDKGYPPDDSTERVIGVVINGDVRAYPISPLARHEVANDFVGGSHIAVTY